MLNSNLFKKHYLDNTNLLYTGCLPEEFDRSDQQFGAMWGLHPEANHQVKMYGKTIDPPRW